ncbi:hypothetical protein DU500_09190 [Haloplanus rubicundus]|uniref:Uncharacterized protein n=1 Tax=Haloplanus rubicundus TaxID=1547898 RepID=A0A345E316_9EURY|nr:hypothetical protein [Haloplanus rubicundus]AXG06588.1 hypothetical protein DU500_09190 [Haloplanus rubicundus]
MTAYAASEDYWREVGKSESESIELPLPDKVITWIQNHPDAEPIQVLAQTGADPDLRDDVVDAIELIHGDTDANDIVDDQEEDESDDLGEPVSKLPELRRPVRGFNSRVLCPACDAEIDDTLAAPVVPTDRLHASARARVDGDTINVRGYECEDCSLVLAVDPSSADVDIGPSKGWIPVRGVFVDGSKRDILVPQPEVSL